MNGKPGHLKDADSFVGPYESWMLRHGKDFDLPALLLDKEPAISAVAEWPGGFDAAAHGIAARVGAIDYPTAMPLLWSGGGSGENFKPSFVPFLFLPTDEKRTPQTLRKQTMGNRPTSLETLERSLASTRKPDGSGPYFRVTFPLFRDTVDATLQPGRKRQKGGRKKNMQGPASGHHGGHRRRDSLRARQFPRSRRLRDPRRLLLVPGSTFPQ